MNAFGRSHVLPQSQAEKHRCCFVPKTSEVQLLLLSSALRFLARLTLTRPLYRGNASGLSLEGNHQLAFNTFRRSRGGH